jgi:hypothetical protein
VIVPKQFDIQDAYTITPHLTNQFKIGYTRFYMPIINPTDTAAGYGSTSQTIGAFGVTNLPGGQAATEFPGVSFGTSKDANTAPATWTTNSNSASTQLTIPNNYSLVDNVQWLKGKHVFTFGLTYQFQGRTVSLLTAPATSANVAILDGVIPSAPNPAAFIAAANANPGNSGLSIAQMLTAFPQYSSMNDGLV